VLHAEMVPNQFDTVFFDPQSTFNIEIETEVVVNQLSFGNQVRTVSYMLVCYSMLAVLYVFSCMDNLAL